MTNWISPNQSSKNISCYALKIALLMQFCFSAMANTPEEYDELGHAFAEALYYQELEKIGELFDLDEFSHRTAKTMFDDPINIESFVRGFRSKGDEKFLSNIFQSLFSQYPEIQYLRTINETQPLLRLSFAQGGHNYIICETEFSELGELAIVDLTFSSTGQQLTQSIGAASQLMLTPSDSLLKKLLGVPELNQNVVKQFIEFSDLSSAGNYADAYGLLQSLPEELRSSRIIVSASLAISQLISDEEYQKQLSLLDQYYGDDESTEFMLIDHHVYLENYDKAINSIDRVISRFGEDAVLLNLKANAYLLKGDISTASQLAHQALDLEPYIEDSYHTLFEVYLAQKNHKELVGVLLTLEEEFDYLFTPDLFETDQYYSEFVKSQAYNDWMY